MEKEITIQQLAEYLIIVSPLSPCMDNNFTQELASRYFVWKARRKYKKYLKNREKLKLLWYNK